MHSCCFYFREGGLSSYAVKLTGTFLSFWVLEKHVRLDPCTWGLPHLSLRVAELGAPGNLGHLDFRVRKEEANFWTCLKLVLFLCAHRRMYFGNFWPVTFFAVLMGCLSMFMPMFGWGIKKISLRHPKKNLESLVFYGPCNSLETKPSISVVFASFWKWSLSPVRFLQDIGPRNRAFAGLDAAVSTAPATLWSSNFWFSMVALKLTLV